MSFNIIIQSLKNEKYKLGVSNSDTIQQVKEKIESELNLGAANSQKLIHKGKILTDNTQTVEDAKIAADDFVVIMISKKKKKAAEAKAAATPPPSTPTTAPLTPAPAPTAAATPSPAPMASATTETTPAAAAATATPSTPSSTTPATPSPAVAASPTATAAASALVMGPEYEGVIQNLMGLGFTHAEVVRAMRASYNNPHRAAEYLFSGIPPGAEAAAGGGPGPAAGSAPAAAGAGGAPDASDVAPALDDSGDGGMEDDEAPDAAGAPGGLPPNLMQLLQSNPQLLQALLQENPQLAQILQNPAALQALMQQMQGGAGGPPGMGGMGGMGGGAPPPGATTVSLTEAEMQAVQNLEALGFSRQQAVQAYLICDRNEELAANYLFDQSNFQ